MIEVSWLVFVIASLVLIATPGQDMILVMSRSVAQGPAAGVATAAGVSVGLVDLALEEIMRRWPEWDVDPAGVVRQHTSTVRGWEKLPVRVP